MFRSYLVTQRQHRNVKGELVVVVVVVVVVVKVSEGGDGKCNIYFLPGPIYGPSPYLE